MTAAEDESALPLNGYDGQPAEWIDAQDPLPDVQWTDQTYVLVALIEVTFQLTLLADL